MGGRLDVVTLQERFTVQGSAPSKPVKVQGRFYTETFERLEGPAPEPLPVWCVRLLFWWPWLVAAASLVLWSGVSSPPWVNAEVWSWGLLLIGAACGLCSWFDVLRAPVDRRLLRLAEFVWSRWRALGSWRGADGVLGEAGRWQRTLRVTPVEVVLSWAPLEGEVKNPVATLRWRSSPEAVETVSKEWVSAPGSPVAPGEAPSSGELVLRHRQVGVSMARPRHNHDMVGLTLRAVSGGAALTLRLLARPWLSPAQLRPLPEMNRAGVLLNAPEQRRLLEAVMEALALEGALPDDVGRLLEHLVQQGFRR